MKSLKKYQLRFWWLFFHTYLYICNHKAQSLQKWNQIMQTFYIPPLKNIHFLTLDLNFWEYFLMYFAYFSIGFFGLILISCKTSLQIVDVYHYLLCVANIFTNVSLIYLP